MKKLITLLLLILLTSCANDKKQERFTNMLIDGSFDTSITLIAYANNQDEFDKYFNHLKKRFNTLHQLFDIYNNYDNVTNVKTINDNAGNYDMAIMKDGKVIGSKLVIDEELMNLIILAKDLSNSSNNKLDITSGALLELWHDYRNLANDNNGIYNAPSNEEINKASKFKGFDKIFINDETNEIFIMDENISLDIGGIAKGYATEIVSQELKELGLVNGIINAGGNTKMIGQKPEGNFVTQLESPNGGTLPLAISVKDNYQVVTSSDLYRYFIDENNVKYHHLIDFDTNYPANYFRQVTVITDQGYIADGLSTIFFTMPFEKGYKYYEDSNYNLDVIWIMDADKAIEHPSGFYLNDFYIITTENIKDYMSLIQ